MKEKDCSTKIVLFRFGLAILALLALHVLVTIYEQLDQASQVLNELTRSAKIPLDYENDNSDKITERFSLPDHETPQSVGKGPTQKQEKLWQTDSHSRRRRNGEHIRTRFQESVISYERRRFYETRHAINPNRFVEKTRSPHARNKKKNGNTENAGKTKHVRKMSLTKLNGNENNNNNSNGNDNNNNTNNKNYNNKKRLPSKVMIVAYRRSGSSFIGEMFNRNPRVFYLFEPIHPVEEIAGMGRYPLLYDTLVGHVLDVIYTCSFNKHPLLVNFLSKSAFRLKSEVLKARGLCARKVTPRNMSRECAKLDATILKRLCNSKDHGRVVKSIRTTVKKILEYVEQSATDSKLYRLNLIHLVRDPRAIISSRLDIFLHKQHVNANSSTIRLRDDQTFTNALRRSVRVASANLCSRIQSDLKYGGQANGNRYMSLRYEDAALRPLNAYEKVSQFSGIPKSEAVADWLKRNTRVADMRDANDEYSTSRNSSASVYSWRRRLPYALVAEVQSQCAEVMETLRYLPARNERELLDVTRPLVHGL
jgi:hypothetical protein